MLKGSSKTANSSSSTTRQYSDSGFSNLGTATTGIQGYAEKGPTRPFHTTNKPVPTIKRISPTEMEKQREQGLCYNCDETYTPGHKCARPQLFFMVADEELEETEVKEHETQIERVTESLTSFDNDILGVSVHVVNETRGIHTLKVEGMLKGKKIQMLIDTGSTHNFISQSIVKTQRIATRTCPTLKVQLADGSAFECSRKVEGLQLKMCRRICSKLIFIAFL